MPTYYVKTVGGLDSNNGLSEELAFLTLTKAESVVVAGDHVFIKNDGNYNETLTLTASGTAGNGSIIFEGYATTPGDLGIAIIDGQSTRANGVTASAARLYRVFRSMEVRNTTSTPWNLGTTGNTCYGTTLISRTNSAGTGFINATLNHLVGCTAIAGYNSAFQMSGATWWLGCNAANHTLGQGFVGASTGNLHMFFCQTTSNNIGGFSASINGGTAAYGVVVGCLLDKRSSASSSGLNIFTGGAGITVINTMILKCADFAFKAGATAQDSSRISIIDPVMLNGNGSTYGNGWGGDARAQQRYVNQAPAFVAEGTDYKPASDTSPQVAAGRDQADKLDIGPYQRRTTAAVGGGSAILRPKILDGGMTT